MRIALGVSGGIAAYKACEIVRGLEQVYRDGNGDGTLTVRVHRCRPARVLRVRR